MREKGRGRDGGREGGREGGWEGGRVCVQMYRGKALMKDGV